MTARRCGASWESTCRESQCNTLLSSHRLLVTKALFEKINSHLDEQGWFTRAGTIVDAEIVVASNPPPPQR